MEAVERVALSMYKSYDHRVTHRNAWLLTSKRWQVVRRMTTLHAEVKSAKPAHVFKNEVQEWGQSFDSLMKSAVGRQIFTRFLEMEYSDENMLFWNACEDFKSVKSSQKRQVMAKEIYEMFLSSSAPLAVNVDSKARDQLINKIEANPTKEIFDLAQDQVYQLMARDCFMRFIQSSVYLDFVQHVLEGGRSWSKLF